MFSTGNIDRDKLLIAAMKQVVASGKTATVELVSRALPGDFQLDAEELDGMLADIAPPDKQPPLIEAAQPEPVVATDTTAGQSERRDGPRLPEPVETTPAPEIGEREARAILDAANKRLSVSRGEMVIAQEKLKQLRGDLATAIFGWQQIGQPQQRTFENLIRDEIRKNQQFKMDVATGKIPPPQRGGPRGRSYIDQSRGYRGDANDFARRSVQETAGLGGQRLVKGHNRGAFSRTEAMQVEAARRRAAAAARKP